MSTTPSTPAPASPLPPAQHQALKTAEKDVEDTALRYFGYGARLRTAFLAGARYLAYTSDVGEAFRPIAHSAVVRAAYGISWAYVLTDVAIETMREKERTTDNSIIARTAIKRAVFQSTASMLFPAITIHQTVHLVSALMKRLGGGNRWIPVIAGLAVIPALPYMFDHPVEHALDYAFDRFWPVPGGSAAHPGHSTHGETKPEVAAVVVKPVEKKQ